MDARDPLPSLALLLNGFTGAAMRVQARRQTAPQEPPLRPVLTRTHLLLPDDVSGFDGSERHRLYRAAVAHAVAHLRHSQASLPSRTLKPMSVAVVSAIEDARVERLLVREYPGLRGWFMEFLLPAAKTPGLGFGALLSRMSLALLDPHYQDDNFWVNKARSLFEAQATDLSDYAAFRAIGSMLANDLGQMRVRFDPGQYTVPAPYRDDNSFLWDHGDQEGSRLDSLDLDVPNPPLREASFDDGVPDDAGAQPLDEVELGRASYPEWDHRLSLSRADWCTVIEKRPAWRGRTPPGHVGPGAAALPLIHLAPSRKLSRKRRLRRQWEGDDIDLNAAIEVMVDQRLDLSPDPRLFMRPGSEERATSILVLLDLSESTHDCVGGTMQSIVDIEKEAALLLAQSVLRDGGRIAIHGFSSNTRAEVYYYRLLDFGAALDATTTGRILGAAARYSTRMGAALRHAAACMAGEPGDHRAIVVITDGAPSDVDVFEPGYLIADARAAVGEARRSGVQTHGVVLHPAADGYARAMFGWRNFQIVDDPRLLPRHLSRLHARLST
jgi:hypothetical protein